MRGIIFYILVTCILNADAYTDMEKKIYGKKTYELLSMKDYAEINKLNKEISIRKRILEERKINYKIALERLKYKEKLERVINLFLIKGKERLRTTISINKELKRLMKVNGIK